MTILNNQTAETYQPQYMDDLSHETINSTSSQRGGVKIQTAGMGTSRNKIVSQ
ncbi:MAG: hypothetical protein N2D54_06730 [Chloroflexota bacterium]